MGRACKSTSIFILLKQFQKAESDLNYISLRLETEFSQQFTESGQDEVRYDLEKSFENVFSTMVYVIYKLLLQSDAMKFIEDS